MWKHDYPCFIRQSRVRNELFNTGANWRSGINFWSPEGKLWSPKIPPPLFSNKSLNKNKKCMVWTFYAQKLHYFRSRYQKATVRVRVKSYFFHKLLFGDIKLSDLERRKRKLCAHDCTDHIKTLFSSDNYHETRVRHVARTRGPFLESPDN